MLKLWGRFLFLTLFFSSALHAQEKIAILVPGFFNIPGQKANAGLTYFSKTIVSAVQAAGYLPIVINDLNPVGSILENGERVRQELNEIAIRYPQAKLTVLAHSAGGFYVGHALTVQPSLPITNVVTISTPYAGAELVELLKRVPGYKTITAALNLTNLNEFQSQSMQQTLASLRIPQHVRWIALGAAQPTCRLLSCAQAQNMSWLLSLAWRFAKMTGDGVVATDSATAKGLSVMSQEGPAMKIETWPDFVIPLEHWEIVLDADFFSIVGVVNTGWIKETQRSVFTQILQQL
ncbi:MAG: esterase/lipase family protein [Bdellovibrionales bacterium]